MRTSIALVLVATFLRESAVGAEAPLPARSAALAAALAREDLSAVRAAVTAERELLGSRAGEPEVPDEFRPVPKDGKLLTRTEAMRGFTPQFAALDKLRWWKVGVDPTTLTAPLRGPASVIAGNVAAARAKLDGSDRSLAIAKDAAEFLLWAQQQAGSGGYPFPAARGTSTARAMEVATRFLGKAEKAGKLDLVVRNGWAFDDLGDGGLQFDNGECGVAMFELYEVTKDPRHLDSARRAADWALSRPLCPNWNYNSFSVYLLAKAHAVTGEAKYLDAAIRKARIGVIPGQLTDGPRAGRWLDPHNARPAYHYIMIRGLAQLAAVLPQGHADRAEILHALRLGLKTRNGEILGRGVMNKDKAIEALLLVQRVFQDDADFLRETQVSDALQAIGLLASEESRRGKAPLSPGEWGKFLVYVATLPADPKRKSASSSPPQPSALERYRLWRARDAAIKRRDEHAIVKFIEINRAVSEAKSWDAGQEQELRRLLEQIEERLALPSVTAIPTELTERDFPFAVPKREHRDVRVASSSGVEAKFQSLDVFAPMQGTRHPLVVWIHGGGRKGGDKADPGVVVLKPDFFVARGWVFASINYRLAPDHKHPAQAEDTAAALAYLHDHAEEFGADRGRIFVIGISAGAQLVAVVATNPRFLARHGKTADMIRAAVILDIGSFDIPTLMDQAGDRAPEMYRYTFQPGRDQWIDCSPFYHVVKDRHVLPLLLYYVAGREHHAVENRRFAHKLAKCGHEATVLAAESKTHLTIELDIGTRGDRVTAEILAFFCQRGAQ